MKRILSIIVLSTAFVDLSYAGIVKVSFSDKITLKNSSPYVLFEGANFGLYGEAGAPELPLLKHIYLLPPEADLNTIQVCLEGVQEEELPGEYEVRPAFPTMPANTDGIVWPADKNIENGRDAAIYNTDAFYPAGYLFNAIPGKLQEYTMADISFTPYKYNPVTKRLKRLIYAQVSITYSALDRKPAMPYGIPYWYAERAKDLCVNYDAVAPFYPSPKRVAEGYAIITVSAIKTASAKLAEFVKSKEKRGFSVKVIEESTWGGGTGNAAAENIRKWLVANYRQMNLKYVLFIGNPVASSWDVPYKQFGPGQTDIYFAEMNGTCDKNGNGKFGEHADAKAGDPDMKAELGVSRIPVYDNNIATLDKILDKIIRYENEDKATAEKWRYNCLCPAYPSDGSTPGNSLGNAMKANFLDELKWGCYRICQNKNPGNVEKTPCNPDIVTECWNANPYGVCCWWTHGHPTGAANIMDLAHNAKLKDDHPTHVYCVSCSNGSPGTKNNISYSMLINGGIGSIAGTGITYYTVAQSNFDNSGSNTASGYNWAKFLIKDRMASAFALSKWREVTTITNDAILYINFVVFNLYGDPSLTPYVFGGSTGMKQETPVTNAPLIRISNSQVRYQVPMLGCGSVPVDIKIHNAKGILVRTLVNEIKNPGTYSVDFDKAGDIAAGIYLCTVNIGDQQMVFKVFGK